MWFLREAVRSDPELAEPVRETLRALLPAVAEALAPSEGEDEIREFALGGLTRRLEIVGVPLASL